jgi:hypothetical protein
MAAFMRMGKMDTSFKVTVLVPISMTSRGWMYMSYLDEPPAPALPPVCVFHEPACARNSS